MAQKLYKIIFWTGYTAVLVTSMMNLPGALDKVRLNMLAFEIRLDHLLHFIAYFLICMYFLVGQIKGLKLFETHALKKFVLVTLVLATVTEFVQLRVPARSFNVMDIVANVAGMLFGVIIIKIQDRRLKIKDQRSKIKDRRSKIEDQRLKIEEGRSKIKDQRSKNADADGRFSKRF